MADTKYIPLANLEKRDVVGYHAVSFGGKLELIQTEQDKIDALPVVKKAIKALKEVRTEDPQMQ